MVCIYCGAPTHVKNSRLQKRPNQVWRRRECTACKALFTTQEAAELGSGLMVNRANSNALEAFSKDRLFVSIYESCKHRPHAVSDASALTQTVIGKLLSIHVAGALARNDIVATTHEVLQRFDPAAATMYHAYHA